MRLCVLWFLLATTEAVNWTAWSRWTTCTKSCGSGTQTRRRRCLSSDGPLELTPVKAIERDERVQRAERRLSESPSLKLEKDCDLKKAFERRSCNTQPCSNNGLTNPSVVKGGVRFYGFSPKIEIKDTPSYEAFKRCLSTSLTSLKSTSKRKAISTLDSAKASQSCKKQVLNKSKRAKRSTGCPDIPTWLPRVTSGLDASILDFLAPVAHLGSNGVENNLYSFTCDFGRKVVIGDTEYDLPDEVSTIYPVSIYDMSLSEEEIKTSSNVKESKSRELSLSGTIKKLAFSGSYSYKSMQQTLKTYERVHFEYRYAVASLIVNMNSLPIDDNDSNPSEAALYIENKLQGHDYSEKARDYQNFVVIYGTHASHRSKFGGLMHGLVSVEKSYAETKSSTQIRREASIKFLKAISLEGVSEDTTTSVSISFQQNSQVKISCFGGDVTGGCSNLKTSTWLPSVESNPHLLSAEALPISDYVTDDQVRNGLETAICRHMAIKYLEDLVQRINNINGLQSFAAPLRNKYNTLKSQAQSHLSTLLSLASASQHEAKCQLVQTSFASDAEELLDDVGEGGQKFRALTAVAPDQPMNSICPSDFFLYRFKSSFSLGHRDRRWDFTCANSVYKHVHPSSCSDTTNYVNALLQAFKYECPSKGVMTGIRSVHTNAKTEDRRFKFRCCALALSSCTAHCSWTTQWTQNEGNMDFTVPAGKYLAGVETKANRRSYRKWFLGKRHYVTDRVWKFKLCQVQNC